MEKKQTDNTEVRGTKKWIVAAVILSRLIFGATFIFSGFVKAIDPVGSAYKFEEYFKAFGLDFLQPYALILAALLATFEFVLGVNTLLGSNRKATARFDLLFMVFMTPLTFYLAIANPVSDCGCFGDALILSNWETFFKNILLSGLAILLLKYNFQIRSIYNKEVQWVTVLYATLFSLSISWIGSYYEPILDFRPYKTGTNIPAKMEIPEDAPSNEYKTTLIYEKDGVKKEFTLQNYPMNDSTWKFVETINLLTKKGYEPPINDFTIVSDKGDDISDIILNHDSYTFLLFSADLKNADDGEINIINEFYDYSVDYGYPFYCVTASSPQEIAEWRDNTGAEYPFCFMDKTTIETIMRSNPGLMLLKDGTIVWKRSILSLPDESFLKEPLENIPALNKMYPYNGKDRLIFLALAFFVPMLLLLLTEKTVAAVIRKIKAKQMQRRNKKEAIENKPENNDPKTEK